jgi:exopolysaccharide biosynthesis polyprenyl glycosylphosphotransferase
VRSGKGVEVSGNAVETAESVPALESAAIEAAAVGEAYGESMDPLSLKQRLMCADAVAIAVGVTIAFVLQGLLRPVPRHIWSAEGRLLVVSLPAWVVAMGMAKLYTARANERRAEETRRIISAIAVGVGTVIALAFAFQFKELSRLWVVALFACVTGALTIERHFARKIFRDLRRAGRISRRIVIVGTDAHAIGLLHTLQRTPEFGYHVVGFVGDDDLGERGGVTVLGTYDQLEQVIEATGAVGVMISLSSVSDGLVNSITRRLTDGGYHVALSSTLRDIDVTRLRPQFIDGRTLIYVEPTIRNGWRAAAKRLFDVSFALLALIPTALVVAVAAVANRMSSPGPVFFRQTRVGRDGQCFEIVKLRTMVVDAEARKAELMDLNECDGALFKIKNDPRITPIGRILRKLSLDELPQFWNVLRGEMSVVGPRPALPDEVAKWPADAHDRLRVLPGITGMWQVSGRSDTSFDEYKRLDLYYVDNWSLLHDLMIVGKTFGAVVSSRGAS